MGKYIFIIILILIIIGGYYWYQNASSNEQDNNDQIPAGVEEQILQSLQDEVNIEYVDLESKDLDWRVEQDEQVNIVQIAGKGFIYTNVSSRDLQNIKDFFENQGFDMSLYNIADGVGGGLVGYQKGKLACLVQHSQQLIGQPNAPSIPVGDAMDIEIKCGIGGDDIIVEQTAEQAISQLLADKYNKKVSEITLTATRQTNDHWQGGVKFTSDGSGEGGIVLAAKVDGKWQLVFDGNGGFSCEMLAEYGFPQDMAEGCYQELN